MFKEVSLAIIAAVEINTNIIGHGANMAWHIPEDMHYFKQKTLNHVVIMGRKTFDSIGKPLPQRYNITLTRGFLLEQDENYLVCHNIKNALESAAKYSKTNKIKPPFMFCIGGGEIYRQLMPIADKLYITEVNMPKIEGDTFFPKIDLEKWNMQKATSWRESPQKNSRDNLHYRFVEYDKIATLFED